MRTSEKYLRLLSGFGETVSIREMQNDLHLEGVGLRHDVDYSLEKALVIAESEAKIGCRASYYLLHTAEYWGTDHFGSQCRELEALGHEVGFHSNVLAEWYRGKADDVAGTIRELTNQLRSTGVNVSGWAAHGDSDCYQGGFTNYWHASELRGEHPEDREDGISAEGIRDPRVDFQIPYPVEGVIRDHEGEAFSLWSIPMRSFGYRYHAVHVNHDRYFSDSGGSWIRSGDPRSVKFKHGRWQVLIHPEYWLEKPRVFLYMGDLETVHSLKQWCFLDASQERKGSVSLLELNKQVSETKDTFVYRVKRSQLSALIGRPITAKKGLGKYPILKEIGLDCKSNRKVIFVERYCESLSCSPSVLLYSLAKGVEKKVRSGKLSISALGTELIEIHVSWPMWRRMWLSFAWRNESQWECSLSYEVEEAGAGLYMTLCDGGQLSFSKEKRGVFFRKAMIRVSSLPKGRRRLVFRLRVPAGKFIFCPLVRQHGGKIAIQIFEFSVVRRFGGIPPETPTLVSITNFAENNR